MNVIRGIVAVSILAALAGAPGAVAHDVACGGGATTGGLCLITCDQTHRLFPGLSHKCTYSPTSYCDIVDLREWTLFDVGEVCTLA